jgi:biotin operon repressor
MQNAGFVDVTDIRRVRSDSITNADARRAGYRDKASLLRDISKRGRTRERLYRVEWRYAGAHDPRAMLAADGKLSDEELALITKKLRAMDHRSPKPWTRPTLDLIATRPAVVSTQLAKQLGMERFAFKANVRKLKALGLTISLDVGYKLSPRGNAYLRSTTP